MTEEQMKRIVATGTAMHLEHLTDDEAIAFNMCLLLGGNPEHNMAWPKVAALFTQKLAGGGVAMHDETKQAAETYLAQRINAIFAKKGESNDAA